MRRRSPKRPLYGPKKLVSVALVAAVAVTVLFGLVVNLKSRAAITGDVNGDGVVNVFDLSVLLANWNKTSGPSDINNDGMVNVFDLSLILSNWGKTSPSPTVSDTPTPDPTDVSTPDPTPTPVATTGCTVASTAKLQDIDTTSDPQGKWNRAAGQKVTIYFTTAGTADKYMTALKTVTDEWSKSACFQLVTTDNCPGTTSNCVNVSETAFTPDPSATPEPSSSPLPPSDADFGAEFVGDEPTDGGTRTGGGLTLDTDILGKDSQGAYTAAISHAVGHALGLMHRLSTTDVMTGRLTASTSYVPDAVDFQNLLVIYGTKN